MKGFIRVSKLLQPVNVPPRNAEIKLTGISKSQKLLVDNGYIRSCGSGLHVLLPLGVRVIEKLCSLISTAMEDIGAQRVSFPALTYTTDWKKSGRWNPDNAELFKLIDRHGKDMLLCPTQEEKATEVLGLCRHPGLVYQIGPKYRDEPRPKGGLLRAREFIMKDMYSGDEDKRSAQATYARVRRQYGFIMKQLGLSALWAKGDVGQMGGIDSHELHLECKAGEDNLTTCKSCAQNFNASLKLDECPVCSGPLSDSFKAIEVAHTFLLGTRYSEPLDVHTVTKDKTKTFLFMGSYGIGVTRLAAASVEVLSTDEVIKWPLPIAPYNVIVIPPKAGSNEASSNKSFVDEVCLRLSSTPWLSGDLLLDDRPLTIGRRIFDAKKSGLPVAVVVGGKKARAEVHSLYNGVEERVETIEDAIPIIKRFIVGEEDSSQLTHDGEVIDEARI